MPTEHFVPLQEVRVRYSETDAMGFAYYGHAAAWFEMARTELIRQRGISYARMEQERGLWLPVLKLEVSYHQSAHYDDLLQLHASWRERGRARFTIGYRITRGEELLISGSTQHCLLDAASGRPRVLPQWFLSQMEAPA